MSHLQQMQSRRNSNKGFTLLELVIVIVILAILAGVAVPRYVRTVNRSRAASALTMLSSLREATQRYYARNNNSYANMTMANIDFDPTDVSGVQGFGYAINGVPALITFDFRATGTACGLAAADTIDVNELGTVTGLGVFAGI